MTNSEQLLNELVQTSKVMSELLKVLVQTSTTMSEILKKLVQRLSITELPGDLVEEILCRVPATSLKRLRTTCRRWNRLYNDDRFARKHSDKALKQFWVLMLTQDFNICQLSINLHGMIPSVEVKSELSLVDPKNPPFQFNIDRVFHCDGLLLCTYGSTIVVWNPLTGQTKWIEAGKRYQDQDMDYTFVLGYNQDNNNKKYKILSFDGHNDSKDLEIYEFNSDSWRILNYNIFPGWSFLYFQHGVSLKGNTYMLAKDETKTQPCISLLKFDFSTEKFGHVPFPYQCYNYEATRLFVVKEEKLSVLLQLHHTSKTEIWVTNKIDETKAVSWSKVLALDLSPDHRISRCGSSLLDEEKKVLICCEIGGIAEGETMTKDTIYIVGEDNKVTKAEFEADTIDDVCLPVIFNYVPNLVQIERAGGKRKRND